MGLRAIRGGAAAPVLPLRLVLTRSWQAARMAVQRNTLPLNAAAAAGQLLTLFEDAYVALSRVDGSDDFAVQVRAYLRSVTEEERLQASTTNSV